MLAARKIASVAAGMAIGIMALSVGHPAQAATMAMSQHTSSSAAAPGDTNWPVPTPGDTNWP